MAKETQLFRTTFDSYKQIRSLGSGGAGTVFEVVDGEGTHKALKLLDPEKATGDRLKRFKNEVQFCLKSSHKNIIRVLDHGLSDSGAPFYVMPMFPGTLRELLKSNIPPQDVLPLYGAILDGVEAAHLSGVCHRDLKPENILYDDRLRTLVIGDFGIARFTQEELYTAVETKKHDRLANFQYSAPEQRARGQVVDVRSDIFALGLILNEMFTNEVPQGAGFRRIAEVAAEYSYLDEIVDRMIQQSRDQRYENIGKVKEELIARGNEFIAAQKLSETKREVILEAEVDDPLVLEPLRPVSFDYEDGLLITNFNKAPNSRWIFHFQNPGSYRSFQGSEPQRFAFHRNVARVPVQESIARQLRDLIFDYTEKANRLYKSEVESLNRKRIQDEKQALEMKVAEAERRRRILQQLSQ
jgi:serine/threonine protein kinase